MQYIILTILMQILVLLISYVNRSDYLRNWRDSLILTASSLSVLMLLHLLLTSNTPTSSIGAVVNSSPHLESKWSPPSILPFIAKGNGVINLFANLTSAEPYMSQCIGISITQSGLTTCAPIPCPKP